MTFAAFAALTALNPGAKPQPNPTLDDLLNNDLPVASKLPSGYQSNSISLPNGQKLTFQANGYGGDGLIASNQLLAMLTGTTTGAGPLVWNGEPIAEEDLVELKPESDGTLRVPVVTKEGKIDPFWKLDSASFLDQPIEAGKAPLLSVGSADAKTQVIISKPESEGKLSSKKFEITSDMKKLQMRIIGNGDMTSTYARLLVSIDGKAPIGWAQQAPTSSRAFEKVEWDLSKILERSVGKSVTAQIDIVDGSKAQFIGIGDVWANASVRALPLKFNYSTKRNSFLDSTLLRVGSNLYREKNLPAFWIAALSPDQGYSEFVTDYRRIGSPQKASVSDRLRIGSVSKILTNLLVLKLIDEGLISWNTRVSDLFPELSSRVVGTAIDATIMDIMSHKSGLPFVSSKDAPYENDGSSWRYKVMRNYLDSPPVGRVGEKVVYSNGGGFVLACMIEKITGMSFEKSFEQKIALQIDLKNQGMGFPFTGQNDLSQPWPHITSDTSPVSASNYIPQNIDFINSQVFSRFNPSGGFYCSIEDLIKIGRALTFDGNFISQSNLSNFYSLNGGFTRGGFLHQA